MTNPNLNLANMAGAVDLTALVNRKAPANAAASEGNSAQAAAAQQGKSNAANLTVEGTDQNFQQILDLSNTVPVVVDLWAEWCGPCRQLSPILDALVEKYQGRFVLAKVDVDANLGLSQLFKAQSIPMVVALIAGKAVPLFVGAKPEAEIDQLLQQLLEFAAQNGVTGVVPAAEPEAETETKLDENHQAAYAAIEQGNYPAAVAAYQRALAVNPKDTDASAGIAQVKLLQRVAEFDANKVRLLAAENPLDPTAQLNVADLDLAGGHLVDAFDRLLSLYPKLEPDAKNDVRSRLLEYFELVGQADPRVIRARQQLTSLLF